MSLDVHLTDPTSRRSSGGSGIFIRAEGGIREITREEWDTAFPGREPVVVDRSEDACVFQANITHNLNGMAAAAGIYEAVWRPAEMDPTRAARIREQEQAKNYHGPGGAYAIEREAVIHARDLIEPLRAGLALLRSDPARFIAMNPENGWGSYDTFVPWVERYLAACERYPDARVEVSR